MIRALSTGCLGRYELSHGESVGLLSASKCIMYIKEKQYHFMVMAWHFYNPSTPFNFI
jgi:hypothetical protein